MADLETLKQRSFVSYNGYEFLTAEVTARDLHALIAIAEAAERAWPYCKDSADEPNPEDDLWDALKALKDA